MVSEISYVGGCKGRCVDTCASRHMCYDIAMFKSYHGAEDKKVLLGVHTPLWLLVHERLS